jgi:hypothetical protein
MGIHLCLSQLGEARQRTATLPSRQGILFCHLQSDMFHGLYQQPPAV